MREIKFRAWDGNKMILVGWDTSRQQGYNSPMSFFEYGYDGYKEVMQYTGLKDKNGKEIYEGDILAPMSESIGPMQVYFVDVCFVATNKLGIWGSLGKMLEPRISDMYSIEVLGNIFENPELLQK